MLAGIALFVRTMMGLIDAIQAGVALGNAMSSDGNRALSGVLGQAHLGAWQDIISNENLNEGQLSMATLVQAAGGEYIEQEGFSGFDPDEYINYSLDATEGAREALSQVTEQAAIAIGHSKNSTTTGIAKWSASRAL